MIANEHNHQTLQSLQNIEQTQPKQQASPEDIERNKICVQDWQNQLSNKKILHNVETNRLIIRIQHNTNIYKSIISIYCPSPGRYKIPNHHYEPQWLYVNRETFKKYHTDIYLSYNPFTLQPEGFALRGQLFLTQPPHKPDVGIYGIKREALDPNIDKLFDLNYLFKNSQPESIHYV